MFLLNKKAILLSIFFFLSPQSILKSNKTNSRKKSLNLLSKDALCKLNIEMLGTTILTGGLFITSNPKSFPLKIIKYGLIVGGVIKIINLLQRKRFINNPEILVNKINKQLQISLKYALNANHLVSKHDIYCSEKITETLSNIYTSLYHLEVLKRDLSFVSILIKHATKESFLSVQNFFNNIIKEVQAAILGVTTKIINHYISINNSMQSYPSMIEHHRFNKSLFQDFNNSYQFLENGLNEIKNTHKNELSIYRFCIRVEKIMPEIINIFSKANIAKAENDIAKDIYNNIKIVKDILEKKLFFADKITDMICEVKRNLI